MKRIGLVEVGLFSSSLLLLGLVIWFFSLTFFGSSNDSQAQISNWAMTPSLMSKVSSAAPFSKENRSIQQDQEPISQNTINSATQPEPPAPMAREFSAPNEAVLPSRNNEDISAPKNSLISPPEGFNDSSSWVPPRPGEENSSAAPVEITKGQETQDKLSKSDDLAAQNVSLAKTPASSAPEDSMPAVPLTKESNNPPASEPVSSVESQKSVVTDQSVHVSQNKSSAQNQEVSQSIKSSDRSAKETKEPVVIAYEPSTTRDPMMTPEESRRVLEQKKAFEEQERRRLEEEIARRKANDPFELAKRKIKIQGVLHTDDGMSVIINNQILQPGDSYAGSKVVQISEHKVTFKFEGKIFSKAVPQE